jgi:glycosyltransferase involved in cell wall biosynthesis
LWPQGVVLPWPGVRILLDYRPALRERTGVGEYVHELAAALDRQRPADDTLTLFSSSWKDRLTSVRLARARIVDTRLPVRFLNFSWHRLEFPPVEWLVGPLDIAHSPSPLLIPTRRAARVVTIHDLDFLDHPERTRNEIRRDYADLASWHARRADAIVAVSRFTAEEVVTRFGVKRERITVCSPGAPPWPPRPSAVGDGPILFMGTLEPRKNVGALLGAYARLLFMLPTVPKLVLAGGAPPAAAAWLDAITKPPLAGHVEHLGYVAPEQRYDLYAKASMLVLPSHLEGFGLPVLEAMTVGVPVIISRRGALPEVAGDAGVVVEPDDHAGLAEAMRRFLTDPGAAAAASERGRARARQYSWDTSATALYGAYRDAIGRRRGARG